MCESRGGRPGLPNKPWGFCGRKATLNWNSPILPFHEACAFIVQGPGCERSVAERVAFIRSSLPCSVPSFSLSLSFFTGTGVKFVTAVCRYHRADLTPSRLSSASLVSLQTPSL